VLRAGVLTGRTIALAGADEALSAALRALGAAADGPPDVLVVDARRPFAAAGGGYDGVRAAIDGAFAAMRDTAVAHWVDAERGGKVVLLAPAPGAGTFAGAARAGLENLARTLSTEWARHAVTTVAVLPGDTTTEPELADLLGWLASPAGAYVSGTALSLG
jgi:NAD(P)-dependent dehydrogenase (short-subunit alcohol dehydrogenase family)